MGIEIHHAYIFYLRLNEIRHRFKREMLRSFDYTLHCLFLLSA